MNLCVHLFIHFSLAVLAGVIAWRVWKRPAVSMAAGLAGGFFIDADHLIDYFLAFGLKFFRGSVLDGSYFLANRKVLILFHGWEYAAVFLLLALVLKNNFWKSLFLGLSLGMFFHLATDVFVNDLSFQFYSITYRALHNFDSGFLF